MIIFEYTTRKPLYFFNICYYFTGEHKSDEFLKLNPHGEVPVLTDGEKSVFEACAILRYLAYKYTNHKDFGKNIADRWKVRHFVFVRYMFVCLGIG